MLAAYAGLFAWSFAAATFLPLSSEVPFAYLIHSRGEVVLPVAVATVGNYLGACTTYWLARVGARAVEQRRRDASPPSRRQVRALAFLRRWGAPALLLSWVPLLGDALVVAAGALRLSFVSSSVFIATGKLARYLAIAWAALSIRAS